MKKETIIKRSAGQQRKGKTDWSRVNRLTDRQIDAAAAGDTAWAGLESIDWNQAVIVAPLRKKAISIRVDEDVLNFFKTEGQGYQRRINAVLRSYMQHASRPKKRA